MKLYIVSLLFLLSPAFAQEALLANRSLKSTYQEKKLVLEEAGTIEEYGLGVWSFKITVPASELESSGFLRPDSETITLHVISPSLGQLESFREKLTTTWGFRIHLTEQLVIQTTEDRCARELEQAWDIQSLDYPSLRFEPVEGRVLAHIVLESGISLPRCKLLKETYSAE